MSRASSSDVPGGDPHEGHAPDNGAPEGGRSPIRRRWGRGVLWVGGVAVAIGLPVGGRVAYEGQREWALADHARMRSDRPAEIEHLGRALRWRDPLMGHDEAALERLWSIAQAADGRGGQRRTEALVAYREVRRALLATRVWGVAHRDRWEQANARIASLMAAQERELGTDLSGDGDPESFHRELLARSPGPPPARGTLAAWAFVGWLGAVGGLVMRGIDAQGRRRARSAWRWGIAVVGLGVVWAVLLAYAHR